MYLFVISIKNTSLFYLTSYSSNWGKFRLCSFLCFASSNKSPPLYGEKKLCGFWCIIICNINHNVFSLFYIPWQKKETFRILELMRAWWVVGGSLVPHWCLHFRLVLKDRHQYIARVEGYHLFLLGDHFNFFFKIDKSLSNFLLLSLQIFFFIQLFYTFFV